ncbi:MAG: metal-dependent hydrolase [Bacteroidota bacterium]|jgi:L-ascorbate metabolism protein UlaG (beta-lactamase superfamily)
MQFTYWGHSCFSLEDSGIHLLFDPFIRPNPLAKHIQISEIKPTHVFISHGHEDHIADAIEIATSSQAMIIGSYEVINWISKHYKGKFQPLNIGGLAIAGQFKVKAVSANHSSSMPDGSYGGVAMGFVISHPSKTLYYSGDTGLSYEMKLVGDIYRPGIGLFPIGGTFTMDHSDAILAAEYCGVPEVIGLHFDTFGPIEIDKKAAQEDFKSKNKKLSLINIGESVDL